MSVLPSPVPNTSGSLSLHISSVPKINKTQFISSYLQEQMIHAKTQAAEGRAFERSWKHEVAQNPTSNLEGTPGPEKASKLAIIDYGLGTPVLKPRVTRRSEDNQEFPPTKDSQIPNIGKGVTHKNDAPETEVSKHKPKRKRPWSPSPQNITNKPQSHRTQKSAKSGSICGSEKEHEHRLKERRERKRAKRAVMKPALNDGSQDESSAEGAKEKKKTTRKSAKDKGLGGFALMHGFTATNVGTGRLTVKPALNVGVFNKGRASLKSRPRQRDKAPDKKGHLGGAFVEGDFLNKTCKSSQERRGTSGSSLSSTNSETSSSLGSRTKKRSRQITQKLQQAKGSALTIDRLRSSPSIAENVRETTKLDKRKPTESIIWDIELESATLPSHLSPSVSGKAISVLLDTKNTSWSKVPVDPAHHHDGVTLFDCQGSPELHPTIPSDHTELTNKRHGSPSIGPSESASQCGNLCSTRHDPPATEAASKYFISVLQPQISYEAKPLFKGLTSELETNKVAVMESLACEFTDTDKKCDSPSMLSPDVVAVQDDKQCASNSIYDRLLHNLDDLPCVGHQDYKYFDHSSQLGAFEDFEDLDCYDGILQAVTPTYSAFDGLDDEKARSENLRFQQWDDLGGAHLQGLDSESTAGYEEQYYTQEDRYDDGYDSPEYQARSTLSFEVASVTHNADSFTWNSEELIHYTRDHWQDKVEMDTAYNPSISGDLDMCINSESGGSVDLRDTFTEGRALLRGYSEAEARAFYSSMPYHHQTQVSVAEADVAKKLKNHWLPQRL